MQGVPCLNDVDASRGVPTTLYRRGPVGQTGCRGNLRAILPRPVLSISAARAPRRTFPTGFLALCARCRKSAHDPPTMIPAGMPPETLARGAFWYAFPCRACKTPVSRLTSSESAFLTEFRVFRGKQPKSGQNRPRKFSDGIPNVTLPQS